MTGDPVKPVPGRATDLDDRLKGLSPAKRALFEQGLKRAPAVVTPAGVTIPRRADPSRAPVSFAQELLWYLHAGNPGLTAYNVPRLYRVEGPLDEAALRTALDALVMRHDILRTTYSAVDDVPEQRVAPQWRVPFAVADLQALPGPDREAEETRLLAEAARTPFDLENEPPLRVLLVRLDPARHGLALVTHHIASDGWSAGILARDLSALYDAATRGTPAALPELEIQYGDFAAWERKELTGRRLHELLDYWVSHLAGAAPTLELPTDRPRPPVPRFHGAAQTALLPAPLTRELRALAEAHDASLFMVLLAGFQGLLHRYTGQLDVVVGTPVAGRARPETEASIGYFVNLLPQRTSFANDPSFSELLERVRTTSLAALDHAALPFSRLVMELGGGQALSHSPIYQVVFALQNLEKTELRFGAASARRVGREGVTAKQDLGLFAGESPDGIRLTAEYRTDLFDAGTIEAMLAHFQVFLTSAARTPDRPVSMLPLLSEPELTDLVTGHNRTAAEYPRTTLLHGLIEAVAGRTPDAIAVDSEAGCLTYRELNQRANQLARRLRELNAAPGMLVGLCVERSPDLMVGLLGILKSGAAYLPLDPEYPPERLGYMLDDSGADIVVGQAKMLGRLPLGSRTVVKLDTEWDEIARGNAADLEPLAGPEDLAYVIYTSGSTGRPKGTMLPHRSVVNYLTWMQRSYPLGAGDAVLLKAPVSFDASVWELYLPLIAGARLVLARPGGQGDPAYLTEAIIGRGLTVLQFVPSLLGVLLDIPEFVAACRGVRLIFCGGEALPAETARRCRERLGAGMHNLYGPTETTVYSTAWEVPANFSGTAVPIGRPIANTQVYVVDRHLVPQPVGVPGELLIAGDGVGKGYHRRPELTAQRFIPDPFRPGPGRLAYRTGDLARWRRDGILEFVGRIDTQVKLRGHRIELGEVEAALAGHPAIRQVVAAIRDEALVAYVVEHSPTRDAQLAAHAGLSLPDYMVPKVWVRLAEVPLTVNGKVDRAALPLPTTAPAADEAPATEMEARVAALWAEVLKRDAVRLRASFFALGGHSLLALRLLGRIATEFGVRLPLRALFDAPTVAELAEVIELEIKLAAVDAVAAGKAAL